MAQLCRVSHVSRLYVFDSVDGVECVASRDKCYGSLWGVTVRKFAWSNKCTVLVYVGRGEQELKGGGRHDVTKKDDTLTDTEKS